MTNIQDSGESILLEAQRLTHGDRNKDYGHPLDDYTKNAGLINALFAHKLKEPFTAAEVALIMVGIKLSRQVNRPKRDNMVDAAGYAWVAHACIEETERRQEMEVLNSGNKPAPFGTCSDCKEPITSFHNINGCPARKTGSANAKWPLPAGADGLATALSRTTLSGVQAPHRDYQPSASQARQCVDECAQVPLSTLKR